jgi:biopolymer transport protein ExbB
VSALLLVLLLQDPLKRAVEEARRELAFEEERIRKEDAVQEAELEKAKAERARLADAWADRSESLARKTKELEALRAERAKLRPVVAALEVSAAEIRRVTADAARKLSDLIAVLPPAESRADQRRLLEALRGGDPDALIPLGTSLLAESRTTAAFPGRVRTVAGVEEEAELFRAGMVVHAYRSPSGTAVALSAPDGEAGWRWSARLPAWAEPDLSAAFESGQAARLPVDVTRAMTLDRGTGPVGAWAMFLAGGPVMIPLALAALLAGALSLERFLFLRRQAAGAERLAQEVLALSGQGRFDEAFRAAESGSTPIARTLAACLKRRGRDVSALEDAVQEQILHEVPRLEQFIAVIGILTGVAPMLGLLGTVTGMMGTFDRITALGSGDPAIMAGGIYEALITTVAGLVIAIPLLLAHGHLGSRVDRIVADLERYSSSLVNVLRKDHGPAA